MFSQQVTNYDQDLGVIMTSPMQMNWLLRSQAFAWYFLPPITSILILWWYALFLTGFLLLLNAVMHCPNSQGTEHSVWLALLCSVALSCWGGSNCCPAMHLVTCAASMLHDETRS